MKGIPELGQLLNNPDNSGRFVNRAVLSNEQRSDLFLVAKSADKAPPQTTPDSASDDVGERRISESESDYTGPLRRTEDRLRSAEIRTGIVMLVLVFVALAVGWLAHS